MDQEGKAQGYFLLYLLDTHVDEMVFCDTHPKRASNAVWKKICCIFICNFDPFSTAFLRNLQTFSYNIAKVNTHFPWLE